MTGSLKKKTIHLASTALVGSLLLTGCSTLLSIKDKSSAAAHSMFMSTPSGDFSSRVYAGASVGAARLSPDTDGTRYTLSDRAGGATQLRLGADINAKLSIELDTSVLGAAAVTEVDADVSYSSITGSAIFYALGSDANRRHRMGWQGYGRLGYSSLQRASVVQPFDGSESNLVVGLGAEYGFNNGFAFRGEVSRFDSDATLFGLGVVYRLGMSARQFGNAVVSVAADTIPTGSRSGAPELGAALPDQALLPGHKSLINEGPNAAVWSQPKSANDADGDGVGDDRDLCMNTAGNTAVSKHGCGLFDSILPDVGFNPGTYWLTPESRTALDELVGTLKAFPEARIEVQAHADSEGPDEVNNILSSARADAVVKYMIEHGVGQKQLVAKGYGETQPVASNDTAEGRSMNRRIQLQTLPSLTPAEIASQNPSDVSDAELDVRVAKVEAPTIEVTMKPSEMQELADAAQSLLPKRSNRVRQTVVADGDTNEPSMAAALPEEQSDDLPEESVPVFKPAVRVKGLGLGGLLEDVNFKPGTTEFETGAVEGLDTVVRQLDTHKHIKVALLVHVNEPSDKATNLSLSQKQADVLVGYLAANGVDRDRLQPEAFGDTLPISQTVNEADRNRNRRVELRVINP